MNIRTALISVYDKTGIVDLARELSGMGIRILSTGGTASLLSQNNIPVTTIEEYTRLPEILEGRVKTLCYKVFSGLLCKRDQEAHVRQLKEQQIDFIDMPEVLRGKYQYFTQADVGKLRASGYTRPLTALGEAVRDYVQEYLMTGRRLGD
jgi:AICAR transformylase/IMP cyclohydrolase PurH